MEEIIKILKNKKVKGYSKDSQKYIEGTVYHHLANGVNVITDKGLIFIEHGNYELIEREEK